MDVASDTQIYKLHCKFIKTLFIKWHFPEASQILNDSPCHVDREFQKPEFLVLPVTGKILSGDYKTNNDDDDSDNNTGLMIKFFIIIIV